MQVNGTTFGIIPDTFPTILQNYLGTLVDTFPNATDPSSPAYTVCYLAAAQDQLLQSAIVSLWNAVNANTAQGLGLDILASTILNLTRPGVSPSSAQITLTLNDIYSVCQIQITVTAGTVPATITLGSTATGGVVTTAPYETRANVVIQTLGVHYFNVYSKDTNTPISSTNFTGLTEAGTPSGLTYTITNPAAATLGKITIPTTWSVANAGDPTIPPYFPNQEQVFTSAGTYNFLVYSTNLIKQINPSQLVTPSNYFNDGFQNVIQSVNNNFPGTLGRGALNDAQFSALRKYYLNVEGQTYYGLEKSIIDLQVASLISIDIAETISDSTNYSVLIVTFSVDASVAPVTLPAGLQVLKSAPPNPTPAYALFETYIVPMDSPGPSTVYLPAYSSDDITVVNIGDISSTNPVIPEILSVTNVVPAILGATLVPDGLGQRGYTVYLEYPTLELNYSVLDITISAIGASPPYIIPVGWTGTTTTMTNAPYMTRQSYQVTTAPSVVQIYVYSEDTVTAVPGNDFTGGDVIPGVTYTIPTSTAATITNSFDPDDPNLQLIADTAFQYHPLGTQFYPALVGATLFTVNTPYSTYTSPVYLNPFQTTLVTVDLKFVYNSDPKDAGYSNGVFDLSLYPTLKDDILRIINTYFLSKTLPTDLVYYINELSVILQNTYTGIVALVGNNLASNYQFSFGVPAGAQDQLFIIRTIGHNFVLTTPNFTFFPVDKDTL